VGCVDPVVGTTAHNVVTSNIVLVYGNLSLMLAASFGFSVPVSSCHGDNRPRLEAAEGEVPYLHYYTSPSKPCRRAPMASCVSPSKHSGAQREEIRKRAAIIQYWTPLKVEMVNGTASRV
jgi:hypothetical protein